MRLAPVGQAVRAAVLRMRVRHAALFGLPLLLSGCALFAVMAAKQNVRVKPTYVRLNDQTVAFMVWADRPMRIEHGALQLDIAQGLDTKFKTEQAHGASELKGTKFPRERGPEAILAYQRNYPGMSDSILDVAPRLGVNRLIYVEVNDFELHPEEVPELFKGFLRANVQVIEVVNGKATIAHNEEVKVTFPEKGPEVGTPNSSEAIIYRGTVDLFTTEVARKFVTYEMESDY